MNRPLALAFSLLFALSAAAAVTVAGTGSMLVARTLHTATLLKNGKVLIAGGYGVKGALASAELYDPQSGTFTATGSLDDARWLHTATMLPDGRVLITGGYGFSARSLASAEVYDPATGRFARIPDMRQPRALHTATLLPNGQVLIIGGVDGRHQLALMERFDPQRNAFTLDGSLPRDIAAHVAVPLDDGRFFIQSPPTNDGSTAKALLLDPVSGTVASTSLSVGFAGGSDVGFRRAHAAVKMNDGRVVLYGGYGSLTIYDAIHDVKQFGNCCETRWGVAVTALHDGTIVATGGTRRPTVDVLNLSTLPQFTKRADLLSSRTDHTATLLADGRLLIAGGTTDTVEPKLRGEILATAEVIGF